MNEINNTLVEETVNSLRRFAAIKSQIDVATKIDKAINTINYLQEQLDLQTKLAQNGQSAIDTSARLAEEIFKLTEENKKYAEEVFKLTDENKKYKDYIVSLLKENIDVCSYCVHDKECKGEKCEHYIEGVGAMDSSGQNYPTFKWRCTDFSFGECPLLEDTPCYKCVENNNKGFEWKGID